MKNLILLGFKTYAKCHKCFKVSFAVKYEKELNITEVVAYKSELISQQKIKVWSKIFFTKKGTLILSTTTTIIIF